MDTQSMTYPIQPVFQIEMPTSFVKWCTYCCDECPAAIKTVSYINTSKHLKRTLVATKRQQTVASKRFVPNGVPIVLTQPKCVFEWLGAQNRTFTFNAHECVTIMILGA